MEAINYLSAYSPGLYYIILFLYLLRKIFIAFNVYIEVGIWHEGGDILIIVTLVLRTKVFNSLLLQLIDSKYGPFTPFDQFNVCKLLRLLGIRDYLLYSLLSIMMMSCPRSEYSFSLYFNMV